MVGDRHKKEKQKKNQVPFRLNVLFIIVFLFFSILVLRLGYVQIVEGESYEQQVEATEKKTSKLDSARGKMLDRNGRLLVDNEPTYGITYTRTQRVTAEDRLELARKLSDYIQKDTDKVTERDKKDYWILQRGLDEAFRMKLSDAEYKQLKESEDDQAAYELLLKRINKKDLSSLDEKDLQVIAILRELNQSMNLTPHFVKKDLNMKTLAPILEQLEQFPGIDPAVFPNRVYPEGREFFFGSIDDIPKGKTDFYTVRGYNHNDQVGTGYLEEYYEDVLNGTPTKLQYVTNQGGDPIGEPTRIEGRRGHDIVLTVDIQLQHKIGKILEETVREAMAEPKNRYLNSAYAVVVNPHTGGILALAGRKYEDGKMKDASYKTVHSQFEIGSTAKPATVLAGFETGTLPGTIRDMPIQLPLGKDFSSYTSHRLGPVNVVQALEKSSNVFMAFIASNLAGIDLIPSGNHYVAKNLPQPGSAQLVNAFETMRKIYSQFGLGVKTQIDLPSEALGYEGDILTSNPGLIMQFAIGQYDSYTPIQLAQYISTIANGGYRMKLHLLKSIREPAVKEGEKGKIVYQYDPQVLNRISMSEEALNIVQTGLRRVVHGGPQATAGSVLGVSPYAKYKIAGKTGTAQILLDKNVKSEHGIAPDKIVESQHELFIGYAPYDNPEVAVAVVVPRDDSGKYHLKLAGRVFQAYFKNKDK